MNIKKVLTVFYYVMRIMLFLISLSGFTVMAIWIFVPSFINKVDKKIVSQYVERYKLRLEYAETLMAGGQRENASKVLFKLIHDLGNIKKHDRLESVKRSVLENLIQLYVEDNKPTQALKWLDYWIEFDDKDLSAQVMYAQLLRGTPGREEESIRIIDSLYQKVSNYLPILNAYVDVLLDSGKNVEAALAAYEFANTLETRISRTDWQVFWDSGNGFNEKRSKAAKPVTYDGQYWGIALVLPKCDLKRLRFDSPGGMNLRIKDISVHLDDGFKRLLLLLENIDVRHNDIISSDNSTFITHGTDPYFYFDVPGNFGSKQEVNVVLRAHVSIILPERLEAVLLDKAVYNQIVTELTKMGEDKAADYITQVVNDFK